MNSSRARNGLVPVGAIALVATALTAAGAPAALATPSPSAFAIIGTITLPQPGDQVAIDLDDDTVYVGSFGGSALYTVSPGATSGTPVSAISLPGRPASLAVDTDDDTVYIRANTGSRIWASSAGRTVDDTIEIGYGFALQSLAVDSDDDTVYGTMAFLFGDDSLVAINGANTDDSVRTQGVGWGTYALGVDQQDDTVWVGGLNSDSVKTVAASTLQVTSVPGVFTQARDLAVDSISHFAYVAVDVSGQATLAKVNSSGSVATWSDPSTTGTLMALSLNPLGTRAVFKTGSNDDSLWIVDTASMQSDGQGLTYHPINQTAQATSGLIYVASYGVSSMGVVAEIQGAVSPSVARAGDPLTISVTPTPSTAAGRPVVVDDSTISSVSFGGVSAPPSRTGTNTFTVTAPAGVTGTVEAVATLNGGATLSLGNVSFGGTPAPDPVPATLASEPTSVEATPGDGSASVSWSAPASTGSFPVSHYLAMSTPGAHTCLVEAPALSCTVTGLTNGTAYTFTAKALTGAGWSAESIPSNVVVPRASAKPTIVISGTREGKRIVVTGRSTGLDAGSTVTPYVARSLGEFTPGVPFAVGVDGSISWSRRASASVVWRVYVAASDAERSNTVTIR